MDCLKGMKAIPDGTQEFQHLSVPANGKRRKPKGKKNTN